MVNGYDLDHSVTVLKLYLCSNTTLFLNVVGEFLYLIKIKAIALSKITIAINSVTGISLQEETRTKFGVLNSKISLWFVLV